MFRFREETPRSVIVDNAYHPEIFLQLVYSNETSKVSSILENGLFLAGIDFRDHATGLSALHIAVGRDNVEMARLLISHGASFFPDAQGRMPSMIAIECKASDEMLDLVLEAEARFDSGSD